MRSLRKRAFVALGLCLSFIVSAAPPAHAAYTYTGTHPSRNHTGTSVWAPRSVDFNSGWDSNANRSWMVFGFDWYQSQHKMEVGQGISIELNAKVDCDWARAYFTLFTPSTPSVSGSEGYDALGFETNIPTNLNVLPYEDTIVFEQCDQANGSTNGVGRGNFGVGMLNAQNLPTGHYWIKVAMDNRQGLSYRGYQSPVELRVKAGAVYDSGSNFAYQDDADCDFTNTETNDWNTADYSHGQTRLEAGYCAFTDWEHQVLPLSAGANTGGLITVNTDYLANQGLEDTSCSGYDCYTFWSGNSATKYCNDAWAAFDGACFVQFNKGSNATGAAMAQDRPRSTPGVQWANGSYTANAALRCRNGSSCSVSVAVFGVWNSVEGTKATATIPDDGHWYICRADYDHVNAGPNTLASYHDLLRFEVYNNSSGNVDVDYTFLGGKTNWKNADTGFMVGGTGPYYWGVGQASPGNICTQK